MRAFPQMTGWRGTEWLWFILILAASTVFWPPFPGGDVPRFAVIYLLAAFSLLELVRYKNFDRLDALIAATVVYAFVSKLWAVDPFGAFGAGIHWLAFGIIAIVARRIDERPILIAVTLAAVWALIADGFMPEYFAGFGNENFATYFFIAALPLVLAVGWGFFSAALIIWIISYLLFTNGSHIEIAAFAAWAALLAVKLTGQARWLVVVAGLCVGAFLLVGLVPDSIYYRLELWATAFKIWWAYPIFGAGLGGFDTLFGVYSSGVSGLTNLDPGATVAGAAHSDVWQLLSDLGAVGAGLALVTLWTALGRSDWPFWTMIGITALAFIDFPLQKPTVALIGALALGQSSPVEREVRGLALTPLILPVSASFIVFGAFMLQSQVFFAKVAAIYTTNVIAAHMYNEWAVWAWPYDKHVRRELLFTALQSGASKEAVERGISAARSAYRENRKIEYLISKYRKVEK